MATQTRRTTRRTARFFRATVTASMVTACCGLVLWSAVTAHASTSGNGVPFNGLALNGLGPNGLPYNGMPRQGLLMNGTPLNGMPLNGIGPNGMPYNGMPRQGMPRNGLPLNGTSLHGHPTHEGSRSPEQSESLPWSTLSQRPLGDAAVPFVRDSRDTLPVALPEVR